MKHPRLSRPCQYHILLYLKSTWSKASLKGIFIADLGICGTCSVENCFLRAISFSPLPVRLCTKFDTEEFYVLIIFHSGKFYSVSDISFIKRYSWQILILKRFVKFLAIRKEIRNFLAHSRLFFVCWFAPTYLLGNKRTHEEYLKQYIHWKSTFLRCQEIRQDVSYRHPD